MRFSGHRILITGAGAGIGRLMAERMAGRGAEVIVTARRIDAAREVSQALFCVQASKSPGGIRCDFLDTGF